MPNAATDDVAEMPEMFGLQDARGVFVSGVAASRMAEQHEAALREPNAPLQSLGNEGVMRSLLRRGDRGKPRPPPGRVRPPPRPETSWLMRARDSYGHTKGMATHVRGAPVYDYLKNLLEPTTSYRQAMQNHGDVQYISHISVGHQQLTGILDTGSFELVVFSRECVSCGRAGKYDHQASASYRKGILLSGQSYGSGSCHSNDAWDTVSIGHFECENQSFWEVTTAHMPILFNAAFQSIIGLGPPETPQSDAWRGASSAVRNISRVLERGERPPSSLLSHATAKTTIASQMFSRRTMVDTFHSPSFSVCIGKEPGSDGFFIWNDTLHLQRSKSFVRVPVVGKHTWSTRMTNARLAFKSQAYLNSRLANPSPTGEHQTWWVRHKPLRKLKTSEGIHVVNASKNMIYLGCDDGCSALVDSGTSLLSLPTAIVDELIISVQKLHANCSNMAEMPHLEFELGGELLSLPPDSYILEVNSFVPTYLANFVRIRSLEGESFGKTHCELAVMETYSTGQFGPLWILGLPFFRSYYTTFSVGESKADRALYLAPASPDCYPMDRHVASKQPVQLYRRQVDLSKVWVPQTAAKAASQGAVLL